MTGTDVITALFNGLSISSVLILTALGLGITFGVMRVINMAHGDMIMLGAYTGYLFTDPHALPGLVRSVGVILSNVANFILRPNEPFYFDFHLRFGQEEDFGFHLNLYWALPISFVVVGAMGYLIEVGLIRFLYGRPLDTLLATWGLGMVLQQGTRLLLGASPRALSLPEGLQGRWEVGGATLTHFRLFIIAFACFCLFAVYLWFYKTPFGLQIRAVTQNRTMASALGISTRRVDSLTFAFGTGLAGVAGCMIAHLNNFHPQIGSEFVVDAFMVVILGGMGQLAGTALAGVSIGTGQSLLYALLRTSPIVLLARSAEMMAKVMMLVLVLGLILYRPAGLFARKERDYE